MNKACAERIPMARGSEIGRQLMSVVRCQRWSKQSHASGFFKRTKLGFKKVCAHREMPDVAGHVEAGSGSKAAELTPVFIDRPANTKWSG